MRYNVKRWQHQNEDKEKTMAVELEDCERLEVVKQVIKAIDYAQNFEAKVASPEEKMINVRNIELHHHPKMEKEKQIDAEHVIIDKNTYFAIRKLGEELLRIIGLRKGNIFS